MDKKNLEYLMKEYPVGLTIPEIQRDYVMGSDEEKIKNIFKGIQEKNSKEVQNSESDPKCIFDFSCLIVRENKESKRLEIYDGQQRITTLFLMYVYFYIKEKGKAPDLNHKVESSDQETVWLKFQGRDKMNTAISKLMECTRENIDDYIDKLKGEICDFSTCSMWKLLNFLKKQTEKITSDFLAKQVRFDYEVVEEKSEMEQFFIDLNGGIKLTEYELYKSKLVSYISKLRAQIPRDKEGETIKKLLMLGMWLCHIDNEWLNLFGELDSFEHPAEEYEIAFIRYCIAMAGIEIKGYENAPTTLMEVSSEPDIDILWRVYCIMQNLCIKNFQFKNVEKIPNDLVHFSWNINNIKGNGNYFEPKPEEEEKKTTKNEKVADKIQKNKLMEMRGAYWNLNFQKDSCSDLICYAVKHLLIDNKLFELLEDIVLWTSIVKGSEAVREVMLLLNNNRFLNVEKQYDAWYGGSECAKKIFYCKNIVLFIPQYYGKHKDKDLKRRYSCQNVMLRTILKYIKNGEPEDQKVKKLLEREKIIKKRELLDIENKCYGLSKELDSLVDDPDREIPRLEDLENMIIQQEVNIYYPIPGNSKGCSGKKGIEQLEGKPYVALQCLCDLSLADPKDNIKERIKNDVKLDNFKKYFWVEIDGNPKFRKLKEKGNFYLSDNYGNVWKYV